MPRLNIAVCNIYINNDNLAFWLELSGINNYTLFNDQAAWAQDLTQPRVAMWETQNFDDSQQVEWLYQNSDLLILFLPEFITDAWCRLYDRDRVVIFAGGMLNWQPQQAKVLFHRYFFWSTTDFYHQYPELLQGLGTPPKPKYFDALLGRQKPHRDLVYNSIDLESNIVSYFKNDSDLRNNHNFVWPSEVLARPQHEVCWTGDEVVVNGTIVSLSQILPVDIYQKTAYSLITETQNENEFSFFTEKIIKPMMAKRLFVVVSGQYYLRNLKKLGFKTFENVIDESYDNEPDPGRRAHLVLEQVNRLQGLDQVKVSQEISSTVEHNYRVIMQTKWLDSMIQDLKEILKIYTI